MSRKGKMFKGMTWHVLVPLIQEPRLVKDVYKTCQENQKRMKVDPFEVMLMRMGFHVSRNGESSDDEDYGGGEGGARDRGGHAWLQDPSACRQS